MKSTLKSLLKFLNQDTEPARIARMLLNLAGYFLLAYFLGDLRSMTLSKTATALGLFGASASFNVYLAPMLTRKESTKWRTFWVLAAITVTIIFLGAFQIMALPMISIIFVGAFTFLNITAREPTE